MRIFADIYKFIIFIEQLIRKRRRNDVQHKIYIVLYWIEKVRNVTSFVSCYTVKNVMKFNLFLIIIIN